MIKGERKKDLRKIINESLTDYDIYKMFCPKDFVLGQKFSSPMPGRGDSDPSFLIGNKLGNYYHVDYGSSNFRGGAIDFVMQIESVDYPTALRLIDTRFGLGVYSPLKDWKKLIGKYQQPQIKENEQEIHIECQYKKFSKEMHDYWNSYHLSEEYLKNKNVFQVKSLFIARKKVYLDSDEIVIAYITEDDKKKIYRPNVLRGTEDKFKWRFRSNIPFDYLFGKENINNCEKSLGLKSRKDELVCSLLLPCVYSTQAESIACFSKENVDFLNKNSKRNIICYGSDDQGVKECKLITSTFGWDYFNTPKKYLPHNDPAEIAKVFGIKELEKLFKIKNII